MDFRPKQLPNLHSVCYLFLLLLSPAISTAQQHASGDAAALLALKSAIDPSNTLKWPSSSSPCSWPGIKDCTPSGRITKLVLEHLNLSGPLPASLLAPLDQLRILSLQSNSLTGPIPDLSSLPNLKSLYLSNNRLSGPVPRWLPQLHRLKVVALAGNNLEGTVPGELGSVTRLYALFLQDNKLTGSLPDLKQDGLRFLNVSNNRLFGEIPTELAKRFNVSCFVGNPGLCGAVVGKPCSPGVVVPPPEPSESDSGGAGSAATAGSVGPVAVDSDEGGGNKNNNKKIAAIVAGSIGGFLILVLALVGLACCVASGNRRTSAVQQSRSVGDKGGAAVAETGEVGGDRHQHGKASSAAPGAVTAGGTPPPGGFSWESEGLGKLIFCGGVGEMYSLEDLLKASAETLGRGAVGSTYKAVMESGFIVTVKRLRDPGFPDPDEFRRRMEALGSLRHPNLVPLRAYFQAKEERLLVYDYFPNGSLYSLIHGSRPSGNGKPLHWTSCLKIAEDVATGLLYLHQQSPAAVVHGDLKSTNVLLGSDFESCLTDYGLVPAFRPYEAGHDDIPGGGGTGNNNDNSGGAASMFYRAPETRSRRPAPASFTPQSDVYSFGVLLLELLTGKTPFQDLVDHRGGADVPRWVRAVRAEEAAADSSGGDDPVAASGAAGGGGTGSSGNEASEEKLGALLSVAMACIAQQPESRPGAKDVLRMIRDARAEVLLVSSNSSDRSPSPARWSDTVQSLPREYGSEHINFAERD